MKTFFLIVLFIANAYGCFAQKLALAKLGSKYGYISEKGEWVISPQFKLAGNFSEDDNLAPVVDKNNKCGYINRKGEWVIQPQYKKISEFDSGIALVSLDGKKGHYIDISGNKIKAEIEIDAIRPFVDGMAIIEVDHKFGALNANGKLAVQAIYQTVNDFEKGYSRVKIGDKWGLINKNGDFFVNAEYDFISDVYSGNIVAKKGDVFGLIVNGNFKEVPGAQKIWDFYFNDKYTYARKDDKIGYLDTTGEWAIQPVYDAGRAFKNGLAPVSKDDKWGYINEKGDVVVAFQFKDAEIFSEDGLAPVKTENGWGFIDTEGKLVVEDKYGITPSKNFFSLLNRYEKGFENGMARVKFKSKWAYINTKGEVLNDLWVDELELFK